MAKKQGGTGKQGKKKAPMMPEDNTEAAQYIKEIAELERVANSTIARYEQKMRTAQQHAVAILTPLNDRMTELFKGLVAFATAHRKELLPDGRKTVDLGTGSMGWRTTPPAVQIKDVEDVIKRIKKLGLVDFIRTQETIDKPAMLKNPEKAKSVQGVSITQNEEFFVKPAELKVEVTGRKWKIKSKKKKGEEEDE
jgi:phage host-nuclease inhibitor protein Gam